eukprot:gene10455-14043_t
MIQFSQLPIPPFIRQWFSRIELVALIILYMAVGPSLIILNQHVLKGLKFPYPMFLSGLGVGASGLFAHVFVQLGFVNLQKKDTIEGILWYKRVLPVGLTHAATLAFGNTVYLYLNVGFIQMLKSFTPVIIMFTGYFAGVETPSIAVIYSIILISIGTAATCSFSAEFSMLGILTMFGAELAEGIRLIFTQFLLQQLKFGIIEGQYVLAPASAFWLFLASFIYEYPKMSSDGKALSIILSNPIIFIGCSCMGIIVNFLSYLVIQRTSSLTMKVLGTLRNILTIVIGVLLYNEVITFQQGLGYTLSLLGFVAYNAAKIGYFDRKPSINNLEPQTANIHLTFKRSDDDDDM